MYHHQRPARETFKVLACGPMCWTVERYCACLSLLHAWNTRKAEEARIWKNQLGTCDLLLVYSHSQIFYSFILFKAFTQTNLKLAHYFCFFFQISLLYYMELSSLFNIFDIFYLMIFMYLMGDNYNASYRSGEAHFGLLASFRIFPR